MTTQLWAAGLVILATLIGSMGPIFLKKASAEKLFSIKSLVRNYNLMAGLGLYAVGTILFIPALKGGELSVLYPMVAVGYIWVSLLSKKVLNEEMNKFKWMGVIVIIIGVSFIGIGS